MVSPVCRYLAAAWTPATATLAFGNVSGQDFKAVAGSLSRYGRTAGTTCQDTPYLSFSHPHCPPDPPADNLSHNSSTSACDWQSMESEIASLNWKCGPPFRARNSTPASLNSTTSARPSGPGVTLVTAESGKTET